MKQGITFNIQKYSIHDGPGIRTTVFLKGCPLECWWCHNPESQKVKQDIIFWPDKCIACRDCEKVCTEGAISFGENGFYQDKSKCKLCEKCTEVCPANALELVGQKKCLDHVMKEVEKDMIFYEESGGGVTFSGGEPLFQVDFLDELLTASKQKGLHTTVDTCGYTSWDNIERIKDKVDLFLYDIKHMDDEKHKLYTGVSNKIVLENLKNLAFAGKNIWVRIPIIPGINDDDLNIEKTCKYLVSLSLKDIFILPYHNIAMDKYKRLNMEYRIPDTMAPDDESMERIADIFKDYGLNVKIGG